MHTREMAPLYLQFSLLTHNTHSFYYAPQVFLTLTFSIRLAQRDPILAKTQSGCGQTHKTRQVRTALMLSASREITAGFYFFFMLPSLPSLQRASAAPVTQDCTHAVLSGAQGSLRGKEIKPTSTLPFPLCMLEKPLGPA